MNGCRWLLPLLAASLAACAPIEPRVEETSAAPLPEAEYAQLSRDGATVYRIDPAESLILVRVGRAGTMARRGHEHAVASEDVEGFVAVFDEPERWRADIAFPIRNLIVDATRYRERLGLETEPSESDIAGTYSNMLRMLDPEAFPWVRGRAQIVTGDIEHPVLLVSITLHGAAFDYVVPVELERSDRRLVANGGATIRHADFGLEPHSALGGLLRVAEELDVEFRFVARKR